MLGRKIPEFDLRGQYGADVLRRLQSPAKAGRSLLDVDQFLHFVAQEQQREVLAAKLAAEFVDGLEQVVGLHAFERNSHLAEPVERVEQRLVETLVQVLRFFRTLKIPENGKVTEIR